MSTKTGIPIVLKAAAPAGRSRGEQLAQAFDLTISQTENPDELRLICDDDRLSLHGPAAMKLGGISVDFTGIDLRSASGNLSPKQPLARAVGAKAATVLDATAGMGQDAFLLACMGYHVLSIERSPVIAALLADGLRRAEQDPQLSRAMGGRLRFLHGDAREILANAADQPDAVYVDPMFPPKRRSSALPKKQIQLLRLVVGDDPDVNELFQQALRAARQRVIVKRPTHAAPLDQPTMSLEGKLVRYDVYVVTAGVNE